MLDETSFPQFKQILFILMRYPFKRQPHHLAKHTQIIRRLLPTNCLSVFDHFVGLALKGLKH